MNQEETKLKDRLRYAFDNTFSRGPGALIIWLGILSIVVITIASIAVVLLGAYPEGETIDFTEAFWRSLMRTMDAGTMGGDAGWGFRIIMFFVTLGGVFIISTLIGVLSSGIEGKLEELRKGRSRVIENKHTVILGWSEQIFTIISELIVANENLPHSCIVILGNQDKVEMEDEIALKVGDTHNTRVVCRSGNPIDPADLSIASLNTARSIIILSPEGADDDADSQVIKTALAILNHPQRRVEPYHIVAEIRDAHNAGVAKVVGKEEVEWIQVGDLVARVIAQTCRQSGLSIVYTELLDFGGDEIYFTEEKGLLGKTFGDAILSYGKNTVIGIVPFGGVASLNPPMETIIRQGDQLIVIAEDDDKILYSPTQPTFQEAAIVSEWKEQTQPEKTLILGWNWRTPQVMAELDHYVEAGSSIVVVASQEECAGEIEKSARDLKNQTLTYKIAETTDRQVLESLDLTSYDHIVVMSYSDHLNTQQADSRTLITLLHLRDIADKRGIDFSLVSEILDVQNRNLAAVTRADDFIVSDKLVSLMLAQVSENKKLNAVFADIFDPEGSEIYLKPAHHYVHPGKNINFYTLVESARRRGEIAIGYRLDSLSHDPEHAYGVVVNPDKSQTITFSESDKVIVIAED